MKLAVITDSSAHLTQDVLHHDDSFILEIPIYIDGGVLCWREPDTRWVSHKRWLPLRELPKTSQPSVAELEEVYLFDSAKWAIRLLSVFFVIWYSQVSTKISNIWSDEFDRRILRPKIPVLLLGMMTGKHCFEMGWCRSFDEICYNVQHQIDGTSAYIMQDDLNQGPGQRYRLWSGASSKNRN